MKKRFVIPAVCVGGGFLGIAALGYVLNYIDIAKCNEGDMTACSEVMESTQDQITNKRWLADKAAADKEAADKKAKQDAEKAAEEAKREALLAKSKKERDERLAKAAAERDARGEWTYSGYVDDATGKRAKTASLTSKNSMNFGFPYSGTQYGQFTVRNHHRFGVDAYLSIDKGQLLCNSYSNSNVLVRFDTGAATSYSCASPADHSSDTVFIHNVAGLEAGMKAAKKMYITVSVYQEGSRTWEFNVKGYDRSKV